MRPGILFCLLLFCLSPLMSWSQNSTSDIAESENQFRSRLPLFKKSLLTESYDVVFHRIELDINPGRKWIYGAVTTVFRPVKPAFNILQFDLMNLVRVDSVVFHGKKMPFTHDAASLTIQLSKSVPQNSLDSVTVFYQGNPGLNNPTQSFVFDAHNAQDPKPVAWTLSQPYGAKTWWPCKESLYDKIDSLDVLVRVPRGNMAASNGLLTDRFQINDSQELFHWKHRYPIVTYLVAVAVTNYVAYNDYVVYPNNDTLPIQNFVYPETESDSRIKTKETIRMLKFFDSLFGPYPFKKEKYGHAQWGWGGGMEHQTMSFMVSFNFDLVAHELAHQWFGDMATCASWSDIWLNEGFATYLNQLCYEGLIGKKDFQNQMDKVRQEIIKAPDGSVYVTDTTKQNRMFSGRLTYNKGAMVLHMLRWKLGDDAFFTGVRNYLKLPDVAYGFGTTNQLKQELEKASGQNLTEFLKDWYYGEGHPELDIVWSKSGNHLSVQIKQTPSHPSVGFFNIPLPFRVSGKTKDTLLIFDPLSRDNTFEATLNFVPESLEFDPEVWILAKSTIRKIRSADESSITIYPSPAGETFYLYNDTGNIEGIDLYDMTGNLVLARDFKMENSAGQSQEISVRDLSSGIYICRIRTTGGTAIRKVIKK